MNGNPGWGDVGRDASGAGGTGAAGRAQGRGAEPAGDRAGARPGGLDRQPRAAAQRAAQGRLPAGARRGLLPASGGSGRPSWSATSGSAGSSASACWRAGRRSRSPAGSSGARSAGSVRCRLETIYAFVHRPGQKGEKLWKLLPRGRARRGRRRARPPRSTIAGRRSIHDRPEAVQERKEAGHWEGDLLICKRTRPVLVLKERKTRFVLAARLAGKSAAETVAVHDGGVPPARPAAAVLDHLRQRHRLRPARPAGERLRHDDLVLRRLRVLAEGGGRERERPAAPRPAAGPRPRRARATPSCRRSSSATTSRRASARFQWFTVGGMFTEAEYTKENEREVYAQLARQGASGATPTVPTVGTRALARGAARSPSGLLAGAYLPSASAH